MSDLYVHDSHIRTRSNKLMIMITMAVTYVLAYEKDCHSYSKTCKFGLKYQIQGKLGVA